MTALDRTMGVALAGLRALAGAEALDRWGQRERVERLVNEATRRGFGAATTAARAFSGSGSGGGEATRPDVQRPPKRLFDLTPTDEQAMLVDALDGFAADGLRPAARKADDACETPVELADTAREFGLLALGVPTALGGWVDDRAAVTTALAMSSLAHGDLGLAAALMAPAAVPTALALHGTADQQQRYLPAMTGDAPPVSALALMEPRAALDPLSPRTTARRTPAGWELTGAKSTVLHVGAAEVFLVSADADGTPTLFLVEGGLDGLRQEAEPTIGVRAGAAGHLVLDHVVVPEHARLGDGDPAILADLVARSRVAWGALAAGTAQAVQDYVIPYVKEREAFGEPIAHRQSVAFAISDMAIEREGLRLTVLRAAALADRGQDFAGVASMARQLTTTHATRIGSDGVQLLGGHGFVKEHPVERWYRDLRAAGVVEGGVLV